MNNERSGSLIGAAIFWGFIVVKAWGTAFAAWSWWWVFIPFVPWLALGLAYIGLL